MFELSVAMDKVVSLIPRLHGTWSGNKTVDKGPSHLECLDGRWDSFSFCENVHLLTDPVMLALRGFPNVARGAPPRPEGL